MALWNKTPALAYALKGNIAYPGNATQAGVVETAAEDAMEDLLGLSSNELAGTFTVKYDVTAA